VFLRQAEANGAPVTVAQLAVTGDDLAALGVPRGAKMGALLEALLLQVMDGTLENEKDALLAAARLLR
ncbi:MAG: tRNA nucleotidyltransferase, partial [Clostridia bacterium]|nr:tRNA nucleotidyltransferase [Clostridia bacterium]